MLVTVKGFGSIWEASFPREGARRFARGVFYNTTGVPANGRMRHRWRLGGKIRFTGAGGFNPNFPLRSLNKVFECDEPRIASPGGWQQMVFRRMLDRPERPAFYLFVVTPARTGRVDLRSAWKSSEVRVIAASEHYEQQEIMLLMPAYAWIRGSVGTFYAEPSKQQPWSAELRLERAGGGNRECAI